MILINGNYVTAFYFSCSAPVTAEQTKIEDQPTPPLATPALVEAANEEFEGMVQNIVDMGYDRTQVCYFCVPFYSLTAHTSWVPC